MGSWLCQDLSTGPDHHLDPFLSSVVAPLVSQPIQKLPRLRSSKLTFCLLCLLQEGKEEDAEPAPGHAHPIKPAANPGEMETF